SEQTNSDARKFGFSSILSFHLGFVIETGTRILSPPWDHQEGYVIMEIENVPIKASESKALKSVVKEQCFSPEKNNINNKMAATNGFVKISSKSAGTQTNEEDIPPEEIQKEAGLLAQDIVSYVAQRKETKAPDRHCQTLRRTVDQLSQKHDIVFKAMVKKLDISQENGYKTFVNVADEIFEDGQVNWGRVVTVYTFGARIAKHCTENDMTEFTPKISEFMGRYVAVRLGKWINENGGWDAFSEYFPDENDVENKVWKGLMFTAIGLGALATMTLAAR
ncbi:unnamed protein product, partial [Owenia fusiformis]